MGTELVVQVFMPRAITANGEFNAYLFCVTGRLAERRGTERGKLAAEFDGGAFAVQWGDDDGIRCARRRAKKNEKTGARSARQRLIRQDDHGEENQHRCP